MIWQWRKFSELTVEELYAVLKLRSEVFVVEQNCFYLDADDKDRFALHLLGMEKKSIVAYLRVFPPKESEVVFGRVVIALAARQKGLGKQLIQEMLNYCDAHFPKTNIKCSAQLYLKHFYESFGFESYGEVYDDAGIPHIDMRKQKN